MEPHATPADTSSPRHRTLPAFLLAAALITGLFGMHILGTSPPGASMTAPASHTSGTPAISIMTSGHMADLDMAPAADAAAPPDGTPVAVGSAFLAADDAVCEGHCGDPMPHHPAQMMCCELSLSTGGTAASNPGPLALPGLPVAVAGHVRSGDVAPVEPAPPPPSLLVLSISRT